MSRHTNAGKSYCKGGTTIVIACLSALLVAMPAAAQTNLLENGDFVSGLASQTRCITFGGCLKKLHFPVVGTQVFDCLV